MTVTLRPDAVEHEFSNGSTALVHPTIPWLVMLRSAALAGDVELVENINRAMRGQPIVDAEGRPDPGGAIAVNDAIVCAMFVEPRIHPRGTPTEEGEWTVDLVPDSVYGEVLELALEEAAAAATFRADEDGAGDGGGGEDVGDDAEPDAGDGAGQPVGVGDGRDAG